MRLRMNNYKRTWDNDNRKWVYEHREAMKQHLGRDLDSSEHIHHINRDYRDNRLNNLEIVTAAEHMSKHRPVYQRKFRPVK